MNKVKLDQGKLLGFKILPKTSKPCVKLAAKIGGKVGDKGPGPV